MEVSILIPSPLKGRPGRPKKRIDEMIFRKYSWLFFFSLAAAYDNMSATSLVAFSASVAAAFDMSATSLVAFSASVAALWKLLLSCLTKT